MKKIFSFAIYTFLLASCGNVNKIDFNEIDHIFIDHNPNEGNNYSSEIDARVCVKTHMGKIIQIDSKNGQKGQNGAVSVLVSTFDIN